MEDRNLFITFEGIDGSGKDTQLYRLAEMIREDNDLFGDKYSNIWITREPTKMTEPGREISRLLKTRHVGLEEATRYFIEDRLAHTQIIRQELENSHVLCSRYDLSTLTYQYAQGMPLERLYDMHKYDEEDGTLIPDVTLFFDLTAEEAAKRMSKRRSEKEYFETLDFQKDVRKKSYEVMDYLSDRDGRKIVVVDANQPIDDVADEMYHKLKDMRF